MPPPPPTSGRSRRPSKTGVRRQIQTTSHKSPHPPFPGGGRPRSSVLNPQSTDSLLLKLCLSGKSRSLRQRIREFHGSVNGCKRAPEGKELKSPDLSRPCCGGWGAGREKKLQIWGGGRRREVIEKPKLRRSSVSFRSWESGGGLRPKDAEGPLPRASLLPFQKGSSGPDRRPSFSFPSGSRSRLDGSGPRPPRRDFRVPPAAPPRPGPPTPLR